MGSYRNNGVHVNVVTESKNRELSTGCESEKYKQNRIRGQFSEATSVCLPTMKCLFWPKQKARIN